MIISLCSGYGGLDRAVAAAFRLPIAAHAEPEKLTARMGKTGTKLIPNPVVAVLEARFPGVPNLGDITAVDWAPWRERCTVLCAGFPCQPVSAAGRQLAEDDERWLWPSVHRAIIELDPEWVVLENVANIVSIQGGRIWAMILDHLREAGYDVTWGVFGACLVGACHHRHRMFLVARKGAGAAAVRWPGKACGVPKGATLPTPTARDWRLTGPSEINGRNSPTLSALPLLLPTPRARDGAGGPGHGSAMQGAESLATIAARELLPTPRASDGLGQGASRNSRGEPAMPSAVQPQHFGRFAWAVDRWADAFGAPPPASVETGMPGQRGGTRMAAPFPEWMMGLRAGYVTDVLSRNDALRAIGNGVMPQQGYAAIGTLLRLLA